MKKRIIGMLISALLVLGVITIEDVISFFDFGYEETINRSPHYSVIRVVDGDTIIIDMDGKEERIRFIGLDAPESVHPDKERNTEYGKIVSEFTAEKLEGESVTLELDVQERDRYGRILAYVYIEDEMFNKVLLEEGYAKAITYPPNVKYTDEFRALESIAKKAKKGLWEEGQ